MRNPCVKCKYYIKQNNTCQSKKCCGQNPTVNWLDKLLCHPCIDEKKKK